MGITNNTFQLVYHNQGEMPNVMTITSDLEGPSPGKKTKGFSTEE